MSKAPKNIASKAAKVDPAVVDDVAKASAESQTEKDGDDATKADGADRHSEQRDADVSADLRKGDDDDDGDDDSGDSSDDSDSDSSDSDSDGDDDSGDGSDDDDDADKADKTADCAEKAERALSALEGKLTEKNDVNKGMYDVGRFADYLSGLSSVMMSAEWEAEQEGDNSPVPAKMRAWLEVGVEIFAEMATEESNELVALGKAAREGAISGAGEELTKVLSERDALAELLAKREEKLDNLAERMEPLAKMFDDLKTANEELTKRLGELEKQPMPPKTASASHAISKAEDSMGSGATGDVDDKTAAISDEDVAKALADMPPLERAKLLMVAAHKMPVQVVERR